MSNTTKKRALNNRSAKSRQRRKVKYTAGITGLGGVNGGNSKKNKGVEGIEGGVQQNKPTPIDEDGMHFEWHTDFTDKDSGQHFASGYAAAIIGPGGFVGYKALDVHRREKQEAQNKQTQKAAEEAAQKQEKKEPSKEDNLRRNYETIIPIGEGIINAYSRLTEHITKNGSTKGFEAQDAYEQQAVADVQNFKSPQDAVAWLKEEREKTQGTLDSVKRQLAALDEKPEEEPAPAAAQQKKPEDAVEKKEPPKPVEKTPKEKTIKERKPVAPWKARTDAPTEEQKARMKHVKKILYKEWGKVYRRVAELKEAGKTKEARRVLLTAGNRYFNYAKEAYERWGDGDALSAFGQSRALKESEQTGENIAESVRERVNALLNQVWKEKTPETIRKWAAYLERKYGALLAQEAAAKETPVEEKTPEAPAPDFDELDKQYDGLLASGALTEDEADELAEVRDRANLTHSPEDVKALADKIADIDAKNNPPVFGEEEQIESDIQNYSDSLDGAYAAESEKNAKWLDDRLNNISVTSDVPVLDKTWELSPEELAKQFPGVNPAVFNEKNLRTLSSLIASIDSPTVSNWIESGGAITGSLIAGLLTNEALQRLSYLDSDRKRINKTYKKLFEKDRTLKGDFSKEDFSDPYSSLNKLISEARTREQVYKDNRDELKRILESELESKIEGGASEEQEPTQSEFSELESRAAAIADVDEFAGKNSLLGVDDYQPGYLQRAYENSVPESLRDDPEIKEAFKKAAEADAAALERHADIRRSGNSESWGAFNAEDDYSMPEEKQAVEAFKNLVAEKQEDAPVVEEEPAAQEDFSELNISSNDAGYDAGNQQFSVDAPNADTFEKNVLAGEDAPDAPVVDMPTAPAAETAPQGQRTDSVPIGDLKLDPERFQFKHDSKNARGYNASKYQGAIFNPDLAGAILVWRDPEDGNLYVVNGHHRYNLALENGYTGNIDVKYSPATTAKGAKQQGALQNIADNKGTGTDVAALIRDGFSKEDMLAQGVSPGNASFNKGVTLSKLAPRLFKELEGGQNLDEDTALIIAETLPDNEDKQVEFYEHYLRKIYENGETPKKDYVESLALSYSMAEGESKGTNLFGEEDINYHEEVEARAKILQKILAELRKDERTFGRINKKNAELLAERNVLDGSLDSDAAKGIKETAKKTIGTIKEEAKFRGPLNDLLKESVRKWLDAGTDKERDAIIEDSVAKLKEYAAGLGRFGVYGDGGGRHPEQSGNLEGDTVHSDGELVQGDAPRLREESEETGRLPDVPAGNGAGVSGVEEEVDAAGGLLAGGDTAGDEDGSGTGSGSEEEAVDAPVIEPEASAEPEPEPESAPTPAVEETAQEEPVSDVTEPAPQEAPAPVESSDAPIVEESAEEETPAPAPTSKENTPPSPTIQSSRYYDAAVEWIKNIWNNNREAGDALIDYVHENRDKDALEWHDGLREIADKYGVEFSDELDRIHGGNVDAPVVPVVGEPNSVVGAVVGENAETPEITAETPEEPSAEAAPDAPVVNETPENPTVKKWDFKGWHSPNGTATFNNGRFAIKFDGFPIKETRDALKRAGFKWDKESKEWYFDGTNWKGEDILPYPEDGDTREQNILKWAAREMYNSNLFDSDDIYRDAFGKLPHGEDESVEETDEEPDAPVITPEPEASAATSEETPQQAPQEPQGAPAAEEPEQEPESAVARDEKAIRRKSDERRKRAKKTASDVVSSHEGKDVVIHTDNTRGYTTSKLNSRKGATRIASWKNVVENNRELFNEAAKAFGEVDTPNVSDEVKQAFAKYLNELKRFSVKPDEDRRKRAEAALADFGKKLIDERQERRIAKNRENNQALESLEIPDNFSNAEEAWKHLEETSQRAGGGRRRESQYDVLGPMAEVALYHGFVEDNEEAEKLFVDMTNHLLEAARLAKQYGIEDERVTKEREAALDDLKKNLAINHADKEKRYEESLLEEKRQYEALTARKTPEDVAKKNPLGAKLGQMLRDRLYEMFGEDKIANNPTERVGSNRSIHGAFEDIREIENADSPFESKRLFNYFINYNFPYGHDELKASIPSAEYEPDDITPQSRLLRVALNRALNPNETGYRKTMATSQDEAEKYFYLAQDEAVRKAWSDAVNLYEKRERFDNSHKRHGYWAGKEWLTGLSDEEKKERRKLTGDATRAVTKLTTLLQDALKREDEGNYEDGVSNPFNFEAAAQAQEENSNPEDAPVLEEQSETVGEEPEAVEETAEADAPVVNDKKKEPELAEPAPDAPVVDQPESESPSASVAKEDFPRVNRNPVEIDRKTITRDSYARQVPKGFNATMFKPGASQNIKNVNSLKPAQKKALKQFYQSAGYIDENGDTTPLGESFWETKRSDGAPTNRRGAVALATSNLINNNALVRWFVDNMDDLKSASDGVPESAVLEALKEQGLSTQEAKKGLDGIKRLAQLHDTSIDLPFVYSKDDGEFYRYTYGANFERQTGMNVASAILYDLYRERDRSKYPSIGYSLREYLNIPGNVFSRYGINDYDAARSILTGLNMDGLLKTTFSLDLDSFETLSPYRITTSELQDIITGREDFDSDSTSKREDALRREEGPYPTLTELVAIDRDIDEGKRTFADLSPREKEDYIHFREGRHYETFTKKPRRSPKERTPEEQAFLDSLPAEIDVHEKRVNDYKARQRNAAQAPRAPEEDDKKKEPELAEPEPAPVVSNEPPKTQPEETVEQRSAKQDYGKAFSEWYRKAVRVPGFVEATLGQTDPGAIFDIAERFNIPTDKIRAAQQRLLAAYGAEPPAQSEPAKTEPQPAPEPAPEPEPTEEQEQATDAPVIDEDGAWESDEVKAAREAYEKIRDESRDLIKAGLQRWLTPYKTRRTFVADIMNAAKNGGSYPEFREIALRHGIPLDSELEEIQERVDRARDAYEESEMSIQLKDDDRARQEEIRRRKEANGEKRYRYARRSEDIYSVDAPVLTF